MARRSRSQRPEKVRNSEAPPSREVPAAAEANAIDRVGKPARGPAAPMPVDEMAALDAGWDELS